MEPKEFIMALGRTSLALAAAVSAIALVGASQEAHAGALGFGTPQISDFTFSNAGGVLTDNGLGTGSVIIGGSLNTESTSATLDSLPPASSTALAIQPLVNQSCEGNCAAVSLNPFSLVTPTLNPATTPFAQAAANLSANSVVNVTVGPPPVLVPACANSN
ncbi:MAG: hypothetical protein ACREFQ_13360, partial [Stellaceae bacterium]